MGSKRRAYPAYRALIHLYPKTYRNEYGDQMVQTLQDMLAETTGSADRIALWTRVIAETPISACKENITNIGEGGMDKLIKISNKRLLVIGVVFVVLVLGIVLGLSKDAILGDVADVFFRGHISELTNQQNAALAYPFARFETSNPSKTSQCDVDQTHNIRAQIVCETSYTSYTKLGQSATEKARMLGAATTITAALQQAGYQGGTNGVTLNSLIAGTYAGKDNSADAYYQKNTGKNVCIFDVMIAYSNPSRPAIRVSLNCSRQLNPFGKPYADGTYYGGLESN